MTKLDSYKPAIGMMTSNVSRKSLASFCRREGIAGRLASVCAWCHPPALTPDLKALDNITHSICAEHAAVQLKSLR